MHLTTMAAHGNGVRLQARELACVRGDRHLFAGLSFAVAAGEAIRIEGPNGAGKTSLLRILCGFLRPAAGTVSWCGTDIRAQAPAYRRALAYVGHAPGVKDDLTPVENLRIVCGTAARRAGVAIETALERVGLAGFEQLPARHLSAGQRRRLALARLCLVDARLWLLDEPFTALDAGGRALVERLLGEHVAGGGIAVLTSHHAVSIEGGAMHQLRLG